MDGGDIGGIVACIALFSVPIVAILTSHQRKMAEIIHGRHREAVANEGVQQEIQQLKQVIYQQSIELDNLKTEVRRGLQQIPAEPLSARLGQDQRIS